ncbi:MAG: hypothetical protein ACQERB_08720 [Promethearchaeati archaeon]
MLELSRISNLFSKESTIKCQKCGYKISRPYPKDNLCPKCGAFVPAIFQINELEKGPELKPKEFETKTSSLSTKLKGKVKVKKSNIKHNLEGKKIELKKGEFVKLFGITSVERTPLFCSNDDYFYLLELTNNLDFIATGILGGELDKMLLIPEALEGKEKCQFFTKDDLIFLVYGMFPDKKGKWLLEQMAKYYIELIEENDVNSLDKFDKYQINMKFDTILKFILGEYLKLQDVFSDQDIPYVEDKLRIDYIGLSSQSIGIISSLLDDSLNIDFPGEFEDPEELREMQESMITARIEAIAANTLGNTGSVPRWIAVKLGYQNYRFLTFKEYDNDYFLYMLSEGNLEKIDLVEKKIEPYLKEVTKNPFSGNLRPFNELKSKLQGFFEKSNEFS